MLPAVAVGIDPAGDQLQRVERAIADFAVDAGAARVLVGIEGQIAALALEVDEALGPGVAETRLPARVRAKRPAA